MEAAYIDYAMLMKERHATKLSQEMFMDLCIRHVSARHYSQDATALRSAIITHLFPKYRTFAADILLGANLVPFTNMSEVFEAAREWGLTPAEMALMQEGDGTLNFCLSLDGLKICADQCPAIQAMLLHVSWIFSAHDLYCL